MAKVKKVGKARIEVKIVGKNTESQIIIEVRMVGKGTMIIIGKLGKDRGAPIIIERKKVEMDIENRIITIEVRKDIKTQITIEVKTQITIEVRTVETTTVKTTTSTQVKQINPSRVEVS
jgi:hypothetical protein